MSNKKRVFICCTGLGRVRRGFETIALRSFDAFKQFDHIDITLFKGGGKSSKSEKVLWNVPRGKWVADKLQYIINVSAFDTEQTSFFISLLPHLFFKSPALVICQELFLARLLYQSRPWTHLSYKILLMNSGGWLPQYGPRYFDFILQGTPNYYQKCCEQGLPKDCQYRIPFIVSEGSYERHPLNTSDRKILRSQLGFPEDKIVILSVAALDRPYKRIDYLIDEVASLKSDKFILVVLGHPQEPDLVSLGRKKLGECFRTMSVDSTIIQQYYQAADLFVHTATEEIYGAVMIEAASYGLRCLLHDTEVSRFMLEDNALFGDFNKQGILADLIVNASHQPLPFETKRKISFFINERFSTKALLPKYNAMLAQILMKG